MKKATFHFVTLLILISCNTDNKKPEREILNESKKKELISEINQMIKLDQGLRAFLQFKTYNQERIDSVINLNNSDQMNYLYTHKSELTKNDEDSLWILQTKYDSINSWKMLDIVQKYGWLNSAKLDSATTHDPIVLLYHTHENVFPKIKKILLEETIEGRMDPNKYANFVDNMTIKIHQYEVEQVYGTNKSFNSETGKFEPPILKSIESVNYKRKEIGLPMLKKGEYTVKYEE